MTDATLIDGKAFSEKLVERVAERAAELSAIIGRPPALAVVLVGDNAASAVYVRIKPVFDRPHAGGGGALDLVAGPVRTQTIVDSF